MVTQALADEVVYFSKEKVTEAMTKAGVMSAGSDHLVIMSRRDGPGESEVHADETDIFYVMEGSATFVTGGTVTDPRSTGPGQIRGRGHPGRPEPRALEGRCDCDPQRNAPLVQRRCLSWWSTSS